MEDQKEGMSFKEIERYKKELIRYVNYPEECESPFHFSENKVEFCRAVISLLDIIIDAQYRAWEE